MPLVFYTSDTGDDTWFGNLFIGRLLMTEFFNAADAADQSNTTDPKARTLTIAGQESWPPLASADDVRYRGEQLMAMNLMAVPVVFASKVDRNGFYQVTQPQVSYNHYGGTVSSCDWSVVLERLGNESELLIESRLIGGERTSHYVGNVAERWHSPGSGAVGYYAGSTVPSSITRDGTEGAVTIYRGLAASSSARWGTTPYDYLDGATRITVANNVMCGTTTQNLSTNWTLHNTVIQIEPNGTDSTFTIYYYNGSEFVNSRAWNVKVGSTVLTDPSYVSILRNDPEECILRLTYLSAAGYSTVDFTLRRGSRFVGISINHQDSQTFTVVPLATAASTDPGNGYIYETANDTDANRFTAGAAIQIDTNTATGAISNHTPETYFSCYVGIESGGTAAVDGDTAADVAAQFLGTPSEDTRMINR